jgi:hypothetical protein
MKPIAKLARIVAIVLSTLSCSAQVANSVDDLLERLGGSDELAAEAAGHLAEHGSDPRTIPALRAKFLNTRTKFTKQSIALSMLRLKVEDATCFDYLASFAWEAVNSDAPSLFLVKDRRPDKLNSEFEEWCKLHGKSVAEESQKQNSGYSVDMLFLIWAHDERAAQIFRKGLLSNNPQVVDRSVTGLGDLGNPSDIESIIEAADRSKEDIDPGVARALSYYRSPRDREAIAKRLQGSRLYDRYVLAVKVDDKLRAMGK